jgi:hypothetical protein
MISNLVRPLQPVSFPEKNFLPTGLGHFLSTGSYDLFVWVRLLIYLLPVAYMVVLAFKSNAQLEDQQAPWLPD